MAWRWHGIAVAESMAFHGMAWHGMKLRIMCIPTAMPCHGAHVMPLPSLVQATYPVFHMPSCCPQRHAGCLQCAAPLPGHRRRAAACAQGLPGALLWWFGACARRARWEHLMAWLCAFEVGHAAPNGTHLGRLPTIAWRPAVSTWQPPQIAIHPCIQHRSFHCSAAAYAHGQPTLSTTCAPLHAVHGGRRPLARRRVLQHADCGSSQRRQCQGGHAHFLRHGGCRWVHS